MATQKKNVIDLNPDINKQIETLRADIALLTKTVKTQATQTAKAKASKVTETATVKAAETKAKYDELASTAEKSIKENPLSAVAIAAVAGMFIGLLSRR